METFLEVTISKEEVKKALNSIEAMKVVLNPYLAKLSTGERNRVHKLTADTIQFIKKTIDYTEAINTLTPNFIDVEELKSDYQTIRLLTEILGPLKQLCSDLNDTILLSGQEAYKSSLNYLYSKEEEAKDNPEADIIYRELSSCLDKIEE